MPKRKLWSVTRIKHPEHPDQPAVRVGEWEPDGNLHVFRWLNGKQWSRKLTGPDVVSLAVAVAGRPVPN